MANTTNLNMVKPAGTDHALISVINSNMDIIDGAVGALPSGSTLQGEIDSANTAITTLNDKMANIVQARNATGTVTCSSLETADVDFTLNKAFTNNPQSYLCALVGSTNLYPITVRSWSDTTHCNIRIFNVGNAGATSVSLTIRIFGFSGGVND